MPVDAVDAEERRRSALAVLLRRTPFSMLLPGCTVAGVEADAKTAEVPRSWRLKTRDDVLVLRNYGDGLYTMTWTVKARMEQTADGVRLEGRLCYLGTRLMDGMWIALVLFLLGVGAWLGITNGSRDNEYLGALGASAVMALPTLFSLWLLPGTERRHQARAKEILRDALTAG